MPPEYFNSPEFAALRLNADQKRSAAYLPARFSVLFWKNRGLWLSVVNESIIDWEDHQ